MATHLNAQQREQIESAVRQAVQTLKQEKPDGFTCADVCEKARTRVPEGITVFVTQPRVSPLLGARMDLICRNAESRDPNIYQLKPSENPAPEKEGVPVAKGASKSLNPVERGPNGVGIPDSIGAGAEGQPPTEKAQGNGNGGDGEEHTAAHDPEKVIGMLMACQNVLRDAGQLEAAQSEGLIIPSKEALRGLSLDELVALADKAKSVMVKLGVNSTHQSAKHLVLLINHATHEILQALVNTYADQLGEGVETDETARADRVTDEVKRLKGLRIKDIEIRHQKETDAFIQALEPNVTIPSRPARSPQPVHQQGVLKPRAIEVPASDAEDSDAPVPDNSPARVSKEHRPPVPAGHNSPSESGRGRRTVSRHDRAEQYVTALQPLVGEKQVTVQRAQAAVKQCLKERQELETIRTVLEDHGINPDQLAERLTELKSRVSSEEHDEQIRKAREELPEAVSKELAELKARPTLEQRDAAVDAARRWPSKPWLIVLASLVVVSVGLGLWAHKEYQGREYLESFVRKAAESGQPITYVDE